MFFQGLIQECKLRSNASQQKIISRSKGIDYLFELVASKYAPRELASLPATAPGYQPEKCGFAVPTPLHSLTAQGHFGLAGMQERAELIDGPLTVDSIPGRGTTVRVVKQSADREA